MCTARWNHSDLRAYRPVCLHSILEYLYPWLLWPPGPHLSFPPNYNSYLFMYLNEVNWVLWTLDWTSLIVSMVDCPAKVAAGVFRGESDVLLYLLPFWLQYLWAWPQGVDRWSQSRGKKIKLAQTRIFQPEVSSFVFCAVLSDLSAYTRYNNRIVWSG